MKRPVTNTVVETSYASRLKKLLIASGIVIVVLSLVVIVLLFSPSSTSSDSTLNGFKNVCTTKSCIKTGKYKINETFHSDLN